jgi:hypothetical protein
MTSAIETVNSITVSPRVVALILLLALAGSTLYNSMAERKQIALSIAAVGDLAGLVTQQQETTSEPRISLEVKPTEVLPRKEEVTPLPRAATEVDEIVRVHPSPPGKNTKDVPKEEPIAWKDCEQMGRGAACNGDANSVMSKDACFAGRECPPVDCLIIPYAELRRAVPAASGVQEIVWACVENPYSPPKSDPFAPIVCADETDNPSETFSSVATAAPPNSNGTTKADVLSDAPPTAETIETYLTHFQRETSWLFPKWRSWNGTCLAKKAGEAPRQLRARRVAPFDTYVIENACVSSRGGIRGFNPTIEHGFEGGYEWARGPNTYGPAVGAWISRFRPLTAEEVANTCFLDTPVIVYPISDFRGRQIGHHIFRGYTIWRTQQDNFPNVSAENILHIFIVAREGIANMGGYEVHRSVLYPTWASLDIENDHGAILRYLNHEGKLWPERWPDSLKSPPPQQPASGPEICFSKLIIASHCTGDCFRPGPHSDALRSPNRYRFGVWDNRFADDAEFLSWRRDAIQKCVFGKLRLHPNAKSPSLVILVRTQSRKFVKFSSVLYNITLHAAALGIRLTVLEDSRVGFPDLYKIIAGADMVIAWVGSGLTFASLMPAGSVVVELLAHGSYSSGCQHASNVFATPMWNHPHYLRGGCDFAANNYLVGLHHAVVMLPGEGYRAGDGDYYVPPSIWEYAIDAMYCKLQQSAPPPQQRTVGKSKPASGATLPSFRRRKSGTPTDCGISHPPFLESERL